MPLGTADRMVDRGWPMAQQSFGLLTPSAVDVDRVLKEIEDLFGGRTKAFCPTGPGGGVDPTCSPGSSGGSEFGGPEKPKGGAGSGNFGHLGRVGKVGGSGQGGGPVKDQDGKFNPGAVGKTLGVDTSSWDKSSSNAQWAMKKLHKMETMAAKGYWSYLAANTYSTNAQYPDKYKKAVLQAQAGIQALKAKATTAPPAGTTPAVNPPVPAPVPKWNKVGGQLGSNPGGTYEFEGKKFYVKFPADPDAAKTEVLACKLYEAAGADVVKAHLVEIDGKTAVATEWIDTKAIDYGNAAQKQKAQENFAAHAWLNNWDAVGAVGDTNNMRMTADGKAVMVDAGGSLDRKATGGKKMFTDDPAAWDDMRNPNINPSAAKVFGDMTPDQLTLSANKLASITNDQIDALCKTYGAGTPTERAHTAHLLQVRKEAILKKTEIVIQKPARTPSQQTDDPTEYVLTGTTPGGSMIYTAAPVSKAPMAVPPPPKVASYAQQHGDKMNAIYEAAKTGDPAQVQKISTNPNATSPWPSKVHAYKMQVLSAMGSGGKTSSDHVVEKVSKTGQKVTIKSEQFPIKPVFVSKNADQKKANEDAVDKAWKHAEAGDLDSLQAMTGSLPPSPKLKTWHSELVSELATQLNPPPPPKSLSQGYLEATNHIQAKHGKEGLQKIGYWTVLGDVGGVPASLPKGSATISQQVWDDGYSKFSELPSGDQGKLKSYTGNGYSSINSSLRTEDKPSSGALQAARASMKAAMPLPSGSTLYRKHGGTVGEFKNLRPGMVVADKGLLSTSSKQTWSGNVSWTIRVGSGVKGVPAKKFSHHSSEQEVILPPNTRMLVTAVKSKGKGTSTYFEVEAIALPTQDSQCCPP